MPKSIIIIGAGLGGLATGCCAQMNGYKTKIFEMQEKPGGVCVAWKRKDYHFDYAVHNVFGVVTNPEIKNTYTQLWAELGALKDTPAYHFEEYVQIEDVDGKKLTLYTDLEKLEAHLRDSRQRIARLLRNSWGQQEKSADTTSSRPCLAGSEQKSRCCP